MRVTNNTLPDTLLNHLQRITKDMNKLNEQVATGQRITKISDDTASANRILDMQEEKGKIVQFSNNASRAQNINNTTISQLENFIDISDRVSEIATLADGLKGSDGIQAYAEEIDELIEHALQSANASFNGEYIFGGTDSGEAPFEVVQMKDSDDNLYTKLSDGTIEKTDSDGNVIAPPAEGHSFPVDGEVMEVSYEGSTVDGAGFHISETGKINPFSDVESNQQLGEFINRMIDLRNSLENEDLDALSTVRENLEDSEDNLIFSLSRQGSVQMRIEFDMNLNEQRFTDLESNISSEADVDLAQTVVRLTQVQNAYQASLQSAGKVLNSSLLDYL